MSKIEESLLELSEREDPVIINNIHILEAMAAADPDKDQGAKTWYVRYGNVDYPLKWIIARAAEHSLDQSVDSRRFHTDEAKKVADELGFEVIER